MRERRHMGWKDVAFIIGFIFRHCLEKNRATRQIYHVRVTLTF